MIASAAIIVTAVIYPWYALPFAALIYLASMPFSIYVKYKGCAIKEKSMVVTKKL